MLFLGLYITRLIMGMGLLEVIREAKKTIIPCPLGLETIKLMGMVGRYRPSTYVMIMPQPEMAESEGDDGDGSQPTPQPQQELIDT